MCILDLKQSIKELHVSRSDSEVNMLNVRGWFQNDPKQHVVPPPPPESVKLPVQLNFLHAPLGQYFKT